MSATTRSDEMNNAERFSLVSLRDVREERMQLERDIVECRVRADLGLIGPDVVESSLYHDLLEEYYAAFDRELNLIVQVRARGEEIEALDEFLRVVQEEVVPEDFAESADERKRRESLKARLYRKIMREVPADWTIAMKHSYANERASAQYPDQIELRRKARNQLKIEAKYRSRERQLRAQRESAWNVPLSQVDQRLPLEEVAGPADEVCSICLEVGTNSKTICNHWFHDIHIMAWYNVSRKCPVCRTHLVTGLTQ